MRILHVSDSYLPRLGGIEVQVDGLARAQRAAGHDVTVATATPGHGDDQGRAHAEPGVERLVLPMPWELPIGRSVAPLVATGKPDVLHVHAGAVSPFAWRAVRRGLGAGLPVVLTVHSLWGPISQATYRGLFASWAWRRDGLVVTAVSEAAARPVRNVVGARVPVRVVSNGVDLERWHDAALWHDLPAPLAVAGDGRMHVVAVGRLAPRKEPINLLRVLRDVASVVPVRATVVGEGPARARMERFLRRHGMDGWVRLTGRLDQAGVRAVLADADVFLAPAARESFGLAALEARLAGVPVVAQAGSGVADFVRSGREGLLGRTFPELAAALVTLARNPALRRRMAMHNRSTEPVRVTWPRVLEEFADCYDQAAGVPLTPIR